MSFEWQTEEDEQHGEIPLTPEPETAESPRKTAKSASIPCWMQPKLPVR